MKIEERGAVEEAVSAGRRERGLNAEPECSMNGGVLPLSCRERISRSGWTRLRLERRRGSAGSWLGGILDRKRKRPADGAPGQSLRGGPDWARNSRGTGVSDQRPRGRAWPRGTSKGPAPGRPPRRRSRGADALNGTARRGSPRSGNKANRRGLGVVPRPRGPEEGGRTAPGSPDPGRGPSFRRRSAVERKPFVRSKHRRKKSVALRVTREQRKRRGPLRAPSGTAEPRQGLSRASTGGPAPRRPRCRAPCSPIPPLAPGLVLRTGSPPLPGR